MTDQSHNFTEGDIADYLLRTPDFFLRHAELLASVQLMHPHSGRAISLADRQLELQREKFKSLERKLHNLLGIGKENVELAGKLHLWMLGLLTYAGTDAAQTHLTSSLQSIFDVPFVAIDARKSSQDKALAMTAPVCGLWADSFFQDMNLGACLGGFAAQSLAIIPLSSVGLLVLASTDPRRFVSNMGTEFLTRLGELAHAALLI